MALTLLSAIPCSRVDLMPCCKDGRGGWVYSQADPSRCFTNFNDQCNLFFAFSVFDSEFASDDTVETTKLIARMDDIEIGTNTLNWNERSWGVHLNPGAIISWPQHIEIQPTVDGLVEVQLFVKLRSQNEPLSVAQKAYCHVRQEDRDDMQLNSFGYFLSRLRRKLKTFR